VFIDIIGMLLTPYSIAAIIGVTELCDLGRQSDGASDRLGTVRARRAALSWRAV
jgi:hypothetical protein